LFDDIDIPEKSKGDNRDCVKNYPDLAFERLGKHHHDDVGYENAT
jgi:hypothetical protein